MSSSGRRNDTLRVLSNGIPFVPLDVRNWTHVEIEEFERYDRERKWIGRAEDNEMTILYYHGGAVVLSKVGNVALRHMLEPNRLKVEINENR